MAVERIGILPLAYKKIKHDLINQYIHMIFEIVSCASGHKELKYHTFVVSE